MEKLFEKVRLVSDSRASVLITGESGTGKEMIASAIHYNSNRSDKPFIKINCAAIPEHLLESELFGHTKGSFTGAYSDKKGKFEIADGGTIFLDEIGEMDLNLQSKLLRVLQEKEIEAVGSLKVKKVDRFRFAAIA
jgi:Nif-specific regulatory protein